MRPSSLGGGWGPHIASHSVCPSVCLSVCLSVRPVIVAIGNVFSSTASVTEVLFGTHWGPHIVRPSRPHRFLFSHIMRRKSKFERLSKIQHVVMLDEFLSLRSMRCHAQRDFCRMSVFFVETVAHIDKPFSPSGRSIILVFWPHHHYKSVKGKSLSGDRRRRGCEVWEHKVFKDAPILCCASREWQSVRREGPKLCETTQISTTI